MEAHMSESLTCQHSNAKQSQRKKRKKEEKKRLATFKTYQLSFWKYTLSVLYGDLIWGRVRYCLQGLIINYDFITLTM